jgi:TRAP-type transport system small permease protein
MIYTSFRHLLSQFLYWVEKCLILFGITLLGVVVFANACEIFLRTAGFRSLYWIQEFTVVSCKYLVFLGAVVLFKRKGDITVTFVYDLFPKSVQKVLLVIVDLLILLFLSFAIAASFSYLSFVWGGYTQTMTLPKVVVYFPILLGLTLMFAVVLDWLLSDIEQPSPKETVTK